MTSNPAARHRQYVLLAVFLLVCSVVIFFTYYEPTSSWLPCSSAPTISTRTPDICTKCLRALEKMSYTQCENHNLVQPATVLLIWQWPSTYRFKAELCSQFGIKGCYFTDNRTQYDKAHAVMFHQKQISGDLPNLVNMSRPPGQLWAWMNMESPENSHLLPGADNLFNLTVNYRRDSDVWVPYGRIVQVSEQDRAFRIPLKDKLVCWIVSNWKKRLKRVAYFNELSKHIKVETYGKHFERNINKEEYKKILPSCKFYLSFENSIYKDYFTEKLFNPLKMGTVPVVLGPPRENYEEFIPADSFIHVDDFKSPQELAEWLKFLDQNQEMYERHFTWRKDYIVQSVVFGLEQSCRICEHVQNHKKFRVVKNISKWYWS